MKKIHRLALWSLTGFLVLGIVGLIAARAWFNAYLNSDGFRKKMGDAAAHALRADSTFMPLHFDGATVYADAFEARGTEAAAFGQVRADQLRAAFNWRGLFHHAWQIDELSAERLAVKLAEHARREHPDDAVREAPKARESASVDDAGDARQRASQATGWRLDLRQAIVRDSRWSWGGIATPPGTLTGAALTLTPGGGAAWLIEAQGGTLAQSGWPELRVERARLRWQKPSLFMTESTLRSGDGRVTASGEINFDEGADVQARLDGINVTPLLSEDWRARLFGKISGDIRVRAPLGSAAMLMPHQDGGARIEGSLILADGRLVALPVLDQIATFTRTQRFRQLTLSKASMDFTRDLNGRLTGRNVVLESEGLLRVEGAFSVVDGQIDGTFQVGVTPASLQWLPGSQERVFTVARGGYLWTPMRLTGAVEHPREDLTARLVAAAGGTIIRDVEGTVRDTAKDVLDILLR